MKYLLATLTSYCAQAHFAMLEPAWDYGEADMSGCDAIRSQEMTDPDTINPFNKSQAVFNTTTSYGATNTDILRQNNALTQCLWMDYRNAFYFNHGTQIGCPFVTGRADCGTPQKPCCSKIAGLIEPTNNDPALLSWETPANEDADQFKLLAEDEMRYHPWRAPGFAPVLDPCGIVGGFQWPTPELYKTGPRTRGSLTPFGAPGVINDATAPPGLGYQAGTYASEIMAGHLAADASDNDGRSRGSIAPVATWVAGGAAKVSQGSLYANHGGGYQYRLCRASEFTADGPSNEECFQRTPLEYASNSSWVQYGDDESNTTEFAAVRVTDGNTAGVKPAGSVWTKFSVPNCADYSCVRDDAANTTEFAPPAPGVFGFGGAEFPIMYEKEQSDAAAQNKTGPTAADAYVEMKRRYDFRIVDAVKVPDGLSGKFVLSWRFDSEQTPQIWSNCAIVNIVRPKDGRSTTKRHSLRG